MELAELVAILRSTGLRVAYHHYIEPPVPPYLVYLYSYSDNFAADNRVYSKTDNYQVELYTTRKDPATEKLVEDALDDAEIYWDKSETWIESEGLYQVIYEIQV